MLTSSSSRSAVPPPSSLPPPSAFTTQYQGRDKPVPLAPNTGDISRHLYTLFDPAFVQAWPDAWFEIAFGDGTTGGVNAAETFSVFELKPAVEFAEMKNRAGCNVYVGPALRQGERPPFGRASDKLVVTSAYAWAEFDRAGDDRRISAILKERGLTPAMVITTGTIPNRRAHLYFKLEGEVTPDELRGANTALYKFLDSDQVHNTSRIMRLAGTINHSTEKKRQERGYVTELVTLHLNPEARAYSVAELIGLWGDPSKPFGKPSGTSQDYSYKAGRNDDELVTLLEQSRKNGNWHNAIRDATASMVGKGWADLQIKLACAPYCNGKYGDPELDQLVQGARGKWDKPDPDTAPDATQETPELPWPVLDDAAYHGLAGDFVKALEPHTEADPVGILIQFLAMFGSMVGNAPYYLVESDRHHMNLFAVLVGNSAKGRKGTGGGRVRAIAKMADLAWHDERTASGLSSGEGLIDNVRDPIARWNAKEKVMEVVDAGVQDKRLMVTEAEFAGTLAVMERHGNTLSQVIRNAWDGLRLQTITRSNPLKATDAHISIVGHITKNEVRARLSRTDMANGFANRFLFCLVRRARLLPHGGHLDETRMVPLGDRLKEAVAAAQKIGRVTMTDAAANAWTESYPELSADRPGLLGAVTARAEAQVIRLALIYAALDCTTETERVEIDTAHLRAAMAVWAYCDESAALVFGDSLGDPVADDILSALHRNPAGMTRTDISNIFGRHRSSDQIGVALALLLKMGRVKFETRHTGGRPVETWFSTGGSR